MAVVTTAQIESTTLITLNRPEARNALSTELAEALWGAVAGAERAGSRGIVLTGAPPAFCAGSDLKELGALDPRGMAEHERATAQCVAEIAHSSVPVVAAVERYALGGGFALALAADIIVAAGDARLHFPEIANGWIPPWGLERLLRRVSHARALQIVWGGHPLSADEALRLGVVDSVCESGGAVESAMRLAGALAKLPAYAVRDAKLAFDRPGGLSDDVLSTAFERHVYESDAQISLERFRRK